jgi:hypothetical protein
LARIFSEASEEESSLMELKFKGVLKCVKFPQRSDVPNCEKWCIAYEKCPETEHCKNIIVCRV